MRKGEKTIQETRTLNERMAAGHGVDLERETDSGIIDGIKRILWGNQQTPMIH